MEPDELLLIARHLTDVEIEPLTKIQEINLLEETLGPFTPLVPEIVPLFVALSLKKSGMCRIRCPLFFEVENLNKILEFELKNENEFSKIHPYLFEIKNDILENVYNLDNEEDVRRLINEIKETRFKKIYNGLKMIDGRAMNLNNITEYELNQIKNYLVNVMNVVHMIEKKSNR